MADHTLKLTVIDGGRTKKKGEIGHIIFPLKDLDIGDGLEQELFKMDLEKVFFYFLKDLLYFFVYPNISSDFCLQYIVKKLIHNTFF